MEVTGAIITGLKTVAGVVFPPLKKKIFDQPKIYLSFKYQSGSKRPQISPKNDTSQPIDIMAAIFYTELRLRYKLTLLNNSEHAAYNIKLIQTNQDHHFTLNPEIDRLRPLISNTETRYDAIFNDIFEGKGYEANEIIEKHPHILTNKIFVLEYTNIKGTKFYTVFDSSQNEAKRNQFSRKYKLNEYRSKGYLCNCSVFVERYGSYKSGIFLYKYECCRQS